MDLASAQISGSRTIIEAATVVNAGGTIEGSEELAIETTEDLLNEGGSLVSGGDIDLEVGGQFANRDGVVSGGGEVEIEAEELYSSGIISGTEGLSIEVEKDLENQGGSLLSEGDIDLEVGGQFANRDGVVSGGGEVEIEAEELYSSGIISGTEGLSIEVEKDLENEGGSLLSEGDIDLEVGGQFANRSGVVSGGGNVRIAAEEIINETLVIREELDGGFAERADRTATIQAGGALSLQATGSITSTGGALRSGEGMRLDAGGDIEIAALRLESQQTNRYWASTESSSSVTHQLAEVTAGGDLRVDAGGDLTVRGAQVLAGGDARLFAVGDTTIASVQDEQRSSGLRGSETIQTQRTTITSGGELTIGSESGDVTLQAVTLRSGGDTILSAAEGTVSLLTETDEASQRFFDRTETLYTWSERRGGSYQETIEHVEMQQGGQLRIVAGDGVVAEREAGAPSQRPELAWMEQLADDPNVTWEEVQADSSSWSSTTRGLTAAGVAREEEQRREAAEAAARAAALRAASATEGGAGSPPAGGLPGAGEQYSLEDPANLPSFRASITGPGDPGEQRPPGQELVITEELSDASETTLDTNDSATGGPSSEQSKPPTRRGAADPPAVMTRITPRGIIFGFNVTGGLPPWTDPSLFPGYGTGFGNWADQSSFPGGFDGGAHSRVSSTYNSYLSDYGLDSNAMNDIYELACSNSPAECASSGWRSSTEGTLPMPGGGGSLSSAEDIAAFIASALIAAALADVLGGNLPNSRDEDIPGAGIEIFPQNTIPGAEIETYPGNPGIVPLGPQLPSEVDPQPIEGVYGITNCEIDPSLCGQSGSQPLEPVWDQGHYSVSGGEQSTGAGDGGVSQAAKRRLAKEQGGILRSAEPTHQGRYGDGTSWWEYTDSQGNRKIVVEHPDGSVHIGRPKPQSLHLEGTGPPRYFPEPGTGHVGE